MKKEVDGGLGECGLFLEKNARRVLRIPKSRGCERAAAQTNRSGAMVFPFPHNIVSSAGLTAPS